MAILDGHSYEDTSELVGDTHMTKSQWLYIDRIRNIIIERNDLRDLCQELVDKCLTDRGAGTVGLPERMDLYDKATNLLSSLTEK